MRKLSACAIILLTVSLSCTLLLGATNTKATRGRGTVPGQTLRRPNFAIIFGKITKIDNSDPAKPKLEVKNDAEGTTHKVDITPWTNVTKVTDISELKTGDSVRILARKVEDGEVAMTVVFGKIRNISAPRTARPTVAAPAAIKAQGAAKK